MRELKSVRRRTRSDNENVKATFEKKHDKEVAQDRVQQLPDESLFSMSLDKEGLNRKRAKLTADRFKAKEPRKMSAAEIKLVKRKQKASLTSSQVVKKTED